MQPRLTDLEVIGEVEAPLERNGGNPPIEILVILRVRFLTGHNQHVRLGNQPDLIGLPAGQGQRQPLQILAGFFDVVGRILIGLIDLRSLPKQIGQVIEAVGKAARTGKMGDGKIVVFALEQAVRIRTGERNEAAL